MSEEIENQLKIADNSSITNINTGDIVVKLNNNNKSIFEIGNIKIYNIKRFNWFNRLMFKLVFGIKIKKIKDSDKE